MLSGEELDLSHAMLRLWGSDAADVAEGYARQHELAGNETVASRWHNVGRIIVDTLSPPSHPVSGVPKTKRARFKQCFQY